MSAGIHIKPSHRGMLHREMGVPKNKKISLGSLMSAEKKAKARGDVAEERRIVFARNARKWNH